MVWQMRKDKILPFRKIGKSIYYSKKEKRVKIINNDRYFILYIYIIEVTLFYQNLQFYNIVIINYL